MNERELASGLQQEGNNSLPVGPTPALSVNLSQQRRDLLKRYGLALFLAGLALLIRGMLPFPPGTTIYLLPVVAVVVSAWYGGRGPGWLASLICGTGALYWFIPPVNSFELSPEHALGLFIFIALCVLLTEFGAGRQRAELALRASAERFRMLVQFSFDVYWETDAKHRFTRQEFSERLTDAPAHGAEIGKTRWEIPYVEPDEEAWRKHRETMDAHLPFRDFELARLTPEGGKRYVSVSGMPVFNRAGRFVGYRGVGRHITEQKRAEAELRARQEMLDLAQKAARAVAFDWYIGARENENRWSPELEALYGLEPGTFDGTYQGWKKLVHPDDWPAVKLAIQRANESGDIAAEYRVIHKGGTVHWLRAKGRMFFDADGQPERMVGFMIDVTDLRKAEDEHRAYLWFLESMDRINRAIQSSDELDAMMSAVLKAALDIFDSDRAWVVYPCDPTAPSWRAIMEHTRPQFPGAFALQEDLPMDVEVAAVFEAAHAASGPVLFGSSYDLKIPAMAADRFAIRSQIAMAIDAKGDKRHLFGLHQCSHARVWTGEEQRLFQEIGRRLGDAIGALSMLRSVRDSERRLEAAQALAHVGWWERDLVAGRMSLSDESCRILGVQPVDLPQWRPGRWLSLIHPEDRSAAGAAREAALAGGPRYDMEYRVIRPDGTMRVVHSQGDVTRDDSGRPLRQFGVMQDITELRRAEDELSEIRERFRVLSESSLTGIYLIENDRFSYVNPALAKMFGYAVEEIVGRLSSDLICPDDRPLVAENVRRRLEGEGLGMRYEFRGLRKDGSVFPVEVHGRRIEHGGKIGVLGTLVDNTERKRAEDELRASEARFRKLTDLSADWYWRQDEHLRFTLSGEEKVGFTPVAVGKTRWELPATPLSASWDEHRAVLAARQPFRDFQYSRIGPDGGMRYVSVSGVPVFDERGSFKGYDGVASDITPRKHAEQELRASEARFRTFVDRATDAFFLMDEQVRIVDVNRQACESLGLSREELIGMHPLDFDVVQDETSIGQLAQRSRAGEIITFETRQRRKDGTVFPVEIRTGKFEQGGKLFYLALARDITERKLAEESLRQSEAYLTEAQRLSHTGSWAFDVASNEYIYTSEEFDRIFGFDPQVEKPTRQAVLERMHPEDRINWRRSWEKSLREKVDTTDEYRIVLPDGRVRHIHRIRHPVLNSAGEVVKLVGSSIDITERKHAEEELRASEARFRTFVDRATDAFFLMDEEVRVVDVNRQACESLGLSREELIGMHPRDFDADMDETSIGQLAQRSRGGEIITFETRHRRKDGTAFPVEIRSGTFEQGGKLFYLALARDITERKLAEESLRQTEAYLTEAQRLSHTGSWAFDVASNRYVYTSEESDRLFGIDPQGEKPTREIIFERIHPEDRSSWKRNLEKSLREKVDTTDDYRVVLPDGTVRHIHTIRHPVVNSAGEVVKLVGTSIDITERKLAEESLRQSEAYLTEAQRLSQTGSWALDVATNRYVYTSEEFDRLFGFDPHAEAPTREAVLERMHPEDRISWKRILEKSVGEKVDTTSQYRIVLPDGTVRHIHTIRHPVVDSTGKVVKLVGTSIDITERKHAEEELRASEARFRTFVDRAADAFLLHDAQLLIVDVNRQACESLGWSREELIGMHPRDFDVVLDETSIGQLARRSRAGEIITFETRHRRKDGTVFPVEVRGGTFEQGGKLFYLALARDISERKLAEETLRGKDYALQVARTELAHVSRLTTLGELTTSIVHEVSQPLGAMINSAAAGARWLAAEPPSMPEARAALDNIAADGKRAREVIARIRALTKRQAPRMGLLDLNRKIVEVVSFAEYELRSHDIVLETKLDSNLPQVTGDRVQLQQVLLNLIINAIEAMSAVTDRPRELTIVSRQDGSAAVLVEVRDCGNGLDAQRTEQVFEAFYTTKAEGIGIGLSISRSIIEAHGGRLWASANEPRGAVFRFLLPVAQEASS